MLVPGPDLWPQEAAQAQLQTNGKEHERNAEIGNGVQCLATMLLEGVQHEAGNQEAHKRWEPELFGKQSEEKRNGDKQRIHNSP
jgi:hypothetical protein